MTTTAGIGSRTSPPSLTWARSKPSAPPGRQDLVAAVVDDAEGAGEGVVVVGDDVEGQLRLLLRGQRLVWQLRTDRDQFDALAFELRQEFGLVVASE